MSALEKLNDIYAFQVEVQKSESVYRDAALRSWSATYHVVPSWLRFVALIPSAFLGALFANDLDLEFPLVLLPPLVCAVGCFVAFSVIRKPAKITFDGSLLKVGEDSVHVQQVSSLKRSSRVVTSASNSNVGMGKRSSTYYSLLAVEGEKSLLLLESPSLEHVDAFEAAIREEFPGDAFAR